MRRRGGGDFERAFSFGGRVPAASGFVLALLVAFSVFDYLVAGRISRWAALDPASVVGGEVWRLATWSLIELQPISLIFAALWIWQTGGQLAWSWGTRRFLAIWFGLTAGAGVAQVIAAVVAPGTTAALPQASPWAVLVALLLMWALQSRGAQMSWFGALNMTSETLAWVLVGGTAIFTIMSRARGTFVTNFAALGIAYAIAGPGLPFRRWWYRFRADLHVRRSRRRASKFKVVSRGGRDEPPRWMN